MLPEMLAGVVLALFLYALPTSQLLRGRGLIDLILNTTLDVPNSFLGSILCVHNDVVSLRVSGQAEIAVSILRQICRFGAVDVVDESLQGDVGVVLKLCALRYSLHHPQAP